MYLCPLNVLCILGAFLSGLYHSTATISTYSRSMFWGHAHKRLSYPSFKWVHCSRLKGACSTYRADTQREAEINTLGYGQRWKDCNKARRAMLRESEVPAIWRTQNVPERGHAGAPDDTYRSLFVYRTNVWMDGACLVPRGWCIFLSECETS